jgi:hypothetical protein
MNRRTVRNAALAIATLWAALVDGNAFAQFAMMPQGAKQASYYDQEIEALPASGCQPVAYWTMGDASTSSTLTDAAGGYNATVHGGVTLGAATAVTGDPETGASFNGSSGYATSSASVFNFEYTQPLCISGVFNLNITRSGGSKEYFVLGRTDTSVNFNGWEMEFYWTGSATHARLILSNHGTGTKIWALAETSGIDISNGVHQVLITYNGNGHTSGMAAYVDGVPVSNFSGTDALAGDSILSSGTFTIGSRNAGHDGFYAGTIQKLMLGFGTFAWPMHEAALEASMSSGRKLAGFGANETPTVILDDDMNDIDDLADVLLANQLHLSGKIALAGIITCDSISTSVSGVKALENYFGLGSTVPLYAYQNNDLATTGGWQSTITSSFNAGDSWSNYSTDIVGYRTLLHNATGPVNIVVGGPLKCLDDLLNSPADGIDSRTGLQLIETKVAAVIMAAGYYPSNAAISCGAPYNLTLNSVFVAAAQDIAANWPSSVPLMDYGIEQATPLCDTGATQNLATGPPSVVTSATDPYYAAYYLESGSLTSGKRPAWTQSALYMLGYGSAPYFRPGGIGGTQTVTSGSDAWTQPAGPWSFLQTVGSFPTLNTTLNTIEWNGVSP